MRLELPENEMPENGYYSPGPSTPGLIQPNLIDREGPSLVVTPDGEVDHFMMGSANSTAVANSVAGDGCFNCTTRRKIVGSDGTKDTEDPTSTTALHDGEGRRNSTPDGQVGLRDRIGCCTWHWFLMVHNINAIPT